MASLENNCEALAIALMEEQPDLAALNTAGGIVHADKSTQTSATSADRIVCEAMPREVYCFGINERTPKVYRVPVKVTIKLATNNVTTLDTYVAAVAAAFSGSPSGAIVTLATSLFTAGGLLINDTDEGEHTQENDERTRAKVFHFLTNA